jgi:hypothetical protein
MLMNNFEWNKLTKLQLGKYAEYFVKMEFTKFGFDVYTAEVDEKGIDFVVKKDDKYYEIQVKSRRENNNYIYAEKSKFVLRDNLLMAVVLFEEGKEPEILLIPSIEWKNKELYPILVDREYSEKKSKPEYGININDKNMPFLKEKYQFIKTLSKSM